MSHADEHDRLAADEFEAQLQRLIADAHENGTEVSGAYVTQLDETTDVEILCTEVQRSVE